MVIAVSEAALEKRIYSGLSSNCPSPIVLVLYIYIYTYYFIIKYIILYIIAFFGDIMRFHHDFFRKTLLALQRGSKPPLSGYQNSNCIHLC